MTILKQYKRKSTVGLLLMLTIYVILGSVNVFAAASTDKHYVSTDPTTGDKVEKDKKQGPTYITFQPGTPQYESYGGMKFWRTVHNGVVHYSPIPPAHLVNEAKDLDLSLLRENKRNTGFGDPGGLFKGPFIDHVNFPNLKKGKMKDGDDSRAGYLGDNSGSTRIDGTLTFIDSNGKTQSIALKGNYEWRYLGYNEDGEPVLNPSFPADYAPATKTSPNYRHGGQVAGCPVNVIHEYPWDKFKASGSGVTPNMAAAVKQTAFDNDNRKLQWLQDYFFAHRSDWWRPVPAGKKMSNEQRIKATAEFYLNRFSLKGNPENGSAVLSMIHTTNCHTYVYSISTIAPPEPNLRVTSFSVSDAETGAVIGTFQRNGSNNNITSSTTTFGKNPTLTPGKTYKITAGVKNMKIPNLKNPKATTYTPLGLHTKVFADKSIGSYDNSKSIFSANAGQKGSGIPWDKSTKLPYGSAVTFNKTTNGEWTYTVPEDGSVKDELQFQIELPLGFYLKGENADTKDDAAELTFKIEKDDIGVMSSAELISPEGASVEEIEPGKSYGLRFTIFKPYGNKPVGGNSPYASLAVTVTDGDTVRSHRPTTDKIMKYKDRVVVEIPNAITPKNPQITATWEIFELHRKNGQSTIHTNDGPYKQRWQSDVNISVNNFKVNPGVVHRRKGEPAGTETVSVSAEMMNSNPTNETKAIDVIVRQFDKNDNLRRTWTFVEYVGPNKPKVFQKTLGNVALEYGSSLYEIEVNYPNPSNRKYIEYRMSNANPYLDNAAYQTMLVREMDDIVKCEANSVTRHNWNTKYSGENINYHMVPFWVSAEYDSKGKVVRPGYWDERCEEKSRSSWSETRSHYEEYKFDKILFKSKITEDNGYGPDGWVDLTKGSNRQHIKVKAGYGFELKFDVKYQTNVTNIPSYWSKSGCGTEKTIKGVTEGKRVSIPASKIKTPGKMYVEMPYTGSSGEKVKYELKASSGTGDWTNHTDSFEMPLRKSVSQKSEMTRKVFVNEGARDATYQIKINTEPFFGVPDKPDRLLTNPSLCDTQVFNIQIIGASSDDVKSHITQ